MEKRPKELYRDFFTITEPYFDQREFKLKIKESLIEKIEKEWTQFIYFDPVWSPFHVSINPIFCFKFNQIQRIWGLFNEYMSGKSSYTLLFRMWDVYKISDREDLEFITQVEDQASLNVFIKHFKVFMDEVGWSLLSRLNSIADYDDFLNHSNPMNDEFQNRVFHRRYASPGLIAAKLNHNPQYEFLYEKYMDILIELNYFDAQAELKALKAYMDAHSVEELLSL